MIITILLRRLFWSIPTLGLVAIFCFLLAELVPGDPVNNYLGLAEVDAPKALNDAAFQKMQYQTTAQELKMDKPIFYFSFFSRALPDTLHRILPLWQRNQLKKIALQHGVWPPIQEFYLATQQLEKELLTLQLPDSLQTLSYQALFQLQRADSIASLPTLLAALPQILTAKKRLQNSIVAFQTPVPTNVLKPRLVWYGLDNRFHGWLFRWLKADFGVSYRDKQPVLKKMGKAIPVSLAVAFPPLLLSFLLSIPLGLWMQNNRHRLSAKRIQTLLYAFYALPVFVVATFLLTLFALPHWGLPRLPIGGWGDTYNFSFFETLRVRIEHLILPWLTLLYGHLAYLILLLRDTLQQQAGFDYVRSARAKGLSTAAALYKHVLPNALLPHFTMLGQWLPGIVSGSLLIELIFNLPGMGQMSYLALQNRDWPLVFGVVALFAVAVIVSQTLAAVLAARRF